MRSSRTIRTACTSCRKSSASRRDSCRSSVGARFLLGTGPRTVKELRYAKLTRSNLSDSGWCLPEQTGAPRQHHCAGGGDDAGRDGTQPGPAENVEANGAVPGLTEGRPEVRRLPLLRRGRLLSAGRRRDQPERLVQALPAESLMFSGTACCRE